MNFNYRTIFRVTSLLLLITGGTMVIPILCAYLFKEEGVIFGFIVACLLSISMGSAGYFLVPRSKRSLQTRDCYMLVFVAWVFCSLLGALPYYLSDFIISFPDAFFESVSGYTTTGASSSFELYIPNSLMLWKAITHWLGGMGILVFMITLLPALGIGGQKLATAEAPGPNITKLAPRIQDIAKLLYFIYIGLTLLEFAFLYASPQISLFDAIINTLGSISTSGLFLHPSGIGYYDSLYIEMVLSIFTILSSLNYVLYVSLIKRDMENIKKNLEIKVYFVILVISTTIVTLSLSFHNTYDSLTQCLRHGFFQVTAFLSSTGYILDSYENWPSVTKVIFFILLIVGGCGSSTSGGLKVIRFLVMIKVISRAIKRKIHRNAVTPIKSGGQVISLQATSAIVTFVIMYFFTFLVASLIISLDGKPLEETMSAALSLMSTTGIFLGETGASGSFAVFSAPCRFFMSILMVVGRLEMFTFFMLFFPSFWNSDRA